MTITDISPESPGVEVRGDRIVVHDLTVNHAEAAAVVRRHLEEDGSAATTELLRRAIPVGLVALSMGTAAVDTGAITRTLDVFADRVDAKSQLALTRLEQTLTQLQAGEQAVADAARHVLGQLPSQVETVLAGEAANVRAAVVDAARTVQTAGLQQLSAALADHSQAMRNALSLDREGPVHMLRQELVTEIHGTRRELADQLSALRGMIEAAAAHKAASAKSSRAVGQDWETQAMTVAESVVVAAGDRFESTGGQPGAGTTRRTGDGVATLSAAISGRTDPVRIALEAKKRSRPMSQAELRREITNARQVRKAAAGIILVPTMAEVPGNGKLCRVDDFGYVVALDDHDAEATLSLVYLIVRELVALLTIRQAAGDDVDLTRLEAQLALAMNAVDQMDEVGRLANQAARSIEKLLEVGKQAQAKARAALAQGAALIHP
jgi:hypothetical protein